MVETLLNIAAIIGLIIVILLGISVVISIINVIVEEIKNRKVKKMLIEELGNSFITALEDFEKEMEESKNKRNPKTTRKNTTKKAEK